MTYHFLKNPLAPIDSSSARLVRQESGNYRHDLATDFEAWGSHFVSQFTSVQGGLELVGRYGMNTVTSLVTRFGVMPVVSGGVELLGLSATGMLPLLLTSFGLALGTTVLMGGIKSIFPNQESLDWGSELMNAAFMAAPANLIGSFFVNKMGFELLAEIPSNIVNVMWQNIPRFFQNISNANNESPHFLEQVIMQMIMQTSDGLLDSLFAMGNHHLGEGFASRARYQPEQPSQNSQRTLPVKTGVRAGASIGGGGGGGRAPIDPWTGERIRSGPTSTSGASKPLQQKVALPKEVDMTGEKAWAVFTMRGPVVMKTELIAQNKERLRTWYDELATAQAEYHLIFRESPQMHTEHSVPTWIVSAATLQKIRKYNSDYENFYLENSKKEPATQYSYLRIVNGRICEVSGKDAGLFAQVFVGQGIFEADDSLTYLRSVSSVSSSREDQKKVGKNTVHPLWNCPNEVSRFQHLTHRTASSRYKVEQEILKRSFEEAIVSLKSPKELRLVTRVVGGGSFGGGIVIFPEKPYQSWVEQQKTLDKHIVLHLRITDDNKYEVISATGPAQTVSKLVNPCLQAEFFSVASTVMVRHRDHLVRLVDWIHS